MDGWAAILQPDGWSSNTANELRRIVLSGKLEQPLKDPDITLGR